MGKMNSREKMQANPEKILEILRNKDLTAAEKAKQIEEITVEETQGGEE